MIAKAPYATVRFLALALLVAAWPSSAQLPASGALSDSDRPLFQAEVARIEKLLATAADKNTLTYVMARTWASAKQWPETMQWLRRVADAKAGPDPSSDTVFAELRGTREFAETVAQIRKSTPPISHSHPAFSIPEGDLAPESVAYDRGRKIFYFGSLRKGKVVRCSKSGDCTSFADGLGIILGLKTFRNTLWLLNNSDRDSALIHFDLASGRIIRKYSVASGHLFNDLVITQAGDVYLTDTRAGAIWYLARDAADLVQLPGKFEAANGITVSNDGKFLYVSTFPDGISVVDVNTHAAAPIARPDDLCLAAVDGLYFHRGASPGSRSLVAIQNGFMGPRVVRLQLTSDERGIQHFDVLERRNSLFDGVTTGVVAGGDFFYMANIQDDKTSGFKPITILRLRL
jgi:hypothetical protein